MHCCPNFHRVLAGFFSIVLVGGVVVALSEFPFAAVQDDNVKDAKVLRHVVMFQFKESSSEKEVAEVVEAFGQLPSKIPQIADYEFGTNNSPEGLNDGFTHCFLVTFKSEEDRAAYLPHEAHQAFVAILKPHLEKVMVIDYWAN